MTDYPEYDVPFILQYGGLSYQAILEASAPLFIVEPSDVNLTPSQLAIIEEEGKRVVAYVSIGEVETGTDFWNRHNLTGDEEFIGDPNPNWDNHFTVDYRNPDWQDLIIADVEELARTGYDGAFLDLVDVFLQFVPEDVEYWDLSPDQQLQYQQEMMDFVVRISDAAGAINPDFRIIPNNASELLNMSPARADAVNAYVNAIDGQLVETTYYNPPAYVDELDAGATADDLRTLPGWEPTEDLDYALAEYGIPIFTIDYLHPDEHARESYPDIEWEVAMQDYMEQATEAGFLPMIGPTGLSLSYFPDANAQFFAQQPFVIEGTPFADFLDGAESDSAMGAARTIVAATQDMDTDAATDPTDFPNAKGSGAALTPS